MTVFNQYRAEHKLGAVTHDDRLCKLSEVRVSEIDTDFSHDGFWKRVNAFMKGYPYYSTLGENLARNYNSASEMMVAWDKSPKHQENLLNPTFTRVCFSVEIQDNQVYAVQILGSIKRIGSKPNGPAL